MPYGKAYTKKRTYTPKKKGAPKGEKAIDKVAEIAKKALRIGNKIKRLINVEYKFLDFTATDTVVPSAGTVIALHEVPQASTTDTVNVREGDVIRPQFLTGRLTLSTNATADVNQIRVIVFRGKHENGVAFAVTDFLETASWLAPRNFDDRARAVTMYDRTFNLTANDPAITKKHNFKFNFKLGGHINYNAGATTVSDGGIYMLIIGDQATNTPSISYYLRLTFTDN